MEKLKTNRLSVVEILKFAFVNFIPKSIDSSNIEIVNKDAQLLVLAKSLLFASTFAISEKLITKGNLDIGVFIHLFMLSYYAIKGSILFGNTPVRYFNIDETKKLFNANLYLDISFGILHLFGTRFLN